MSKQQASVDVLEGNKIIEWNFLIAKFMGWTYPHIEAFKRDIVFHESHNYDTRWDKLMPVVEKIEKIKGVHCVISELGCDIYSFGKHISNCREETKILTVWQAVIQFIQWYNTQTKKQ